MGVALQVLLVPVGGIEGAAIATIATLAAGQILLLLDPAGREAVVEAWRAVLQPVVLAVGVLVAVWPVSDPLLAALGAGVLFPIGAWLAGVVDRAALVRLGRELRRGPR
jgi:O-antigen/teichoic acid export membrane protein